MDPTVAFLWARHRGELCEADAWATRLLEQGLETDAVLRLCDPHLPGENRDRLIPQAVADAGYAHLSDIRLLRRAYEAELIGDFFAGGLAGRDLLQEGLDLYYRDRDDDHGLDFWMLIACDSSGHEDYRLYAKWNFENADFDEVLKTALKESGRPLGRIPPVHHNG